MIGRVATRIGLALCLVAINLVPARAQDFDREVAFLTIPTGARLVGMGRAASALPGEFQSVRWNPATLAGVPGVRPLVSLYEGPLEFTVNQFAVALPVQAVGTFGLSAEIQSFGEIALAGPDSPENAQGSVSPSNLVFGVSFSRPLFPAVAVGATGKWVHSELVGDLSGSTMALDLGLLITPSAALPLNLGFSATNLGPGLDITGDPNVEADPLPARLRFGFAYDILAHLRGDDLWRLLIAVDIEHAARDLGTSSQYLGGELGFAEVVHFRAGLISETLIETNTGTTFGLGLRLGVFIVDLALEQGVNQLGDETHVSLGAVF